MKYIFILFTSFCFGQFNPIFFNRVDNSLRKSLVAYYTLDNVNNDSRGVTNSMTLTGGLTYGTGKINNGLDFNGLNKQGEITDNGTYNLSFTTGTSDLPFSISFWVQFSAFSSNGNRIFSKRSSTGASALSEYQVICTSTSVFINKGSGGDFAINKTTTALMTWALNTWYHIVITSNGVSEIIYINSASSSGATSTTGSYTSMVLGSTSLYVGEVPFLANCEHQGKIDEVAIWKSRQLSQSEINIIYNSGAGKQYPF